MDKIILSPIELSELLDSFRGIMREEIQADHLKEQGEKLLSPSEACKLFQPPITKPTLKSWAGKNLLQEHRIGSRVFFKQSEIISSLKTLKKYKAV